MIASNIICDDIYFNKSWCIVGQGTFALREVNQMEREMCSYLELQLNIEPKNLKGFEDKVCRDFAGPGPYPPIVLPQPAPSPFAHPGASSSTSIPSFGALHVATQTSTCRHRRQPDHVLPIPVNTRYPIILALHFHLTCFVGLATHTTRLARSL